MAEQTEWQVASQDAEQTVGVVWKLLTDAEAKLAALRSMTVAEDKSCRLCGAVMAKRIGRFGPYYSCSRYPDCKYTTSDKWPNAAGRHNADARYSAGLPVLASEFVDAPATTTEAKEHYESHLETNHRSASALNAFDLRKAFLEYLRGPWPGSGWVKRTDMCQATKAWLRWGKYVSSILRWTKWWQRV